MVQKPLCPPLTTIFSGVHLPWANRRGLGGRRWPALRTPIVLRQATRMPTATSSCGLNPTHVDKSPRKKSRPQRTAIVPIFAIDRTSRSRHSDGLYFYQSQSRRFQAFPQSFNFCSCTLPSAYRRQLPQGGRDWQPLRKTVDRQKRHNLHRHHALSPRPEIA